MQLVYVGISEINVWWKKKIRPATCLQWAFKRKHYAIRRTAVIIIITLCTFHLIQALYSWCNMFTFAPSFLCFRFYLSQLHLNTFLVFEISKSDTIKAQKSSFLIACYFRRNMSWKIVSEPGHEKMCLMSYANNKGADQPAHARSLISAFVVRCLDSLISLLDSVAEISRL